LKHTASSHDCFSGLHTPEMLLVAATSVHED